MFVPLHTSRFAAVVLAGALTVTACGGSSGTITVKGDGGPTNDGARPAEGVSVLSLQQAAHRTSAIEAGGFEMTIGVSHGATGSMDMTMSGKFSGVRSQFSMSTKLSGLGDSAGELGGLGGMLDMEMVTDGDTAYAKGGMFAALLGADAESWVRMPASAASTSVDANLSRNAMMGLLDGAYGDVTEEGSDDVRGVATTHYRVLLDPAKIAQSEVFGGVGGGALRGGDAAPIDVWLDAEGVLRRMAMLIDEDGSSTSMNMEMFDLGGPVEIQIPTDAVDVDPEALGGSLFGGLDQALGGGLDGGLTEGD